MSLEDQARRLVDHLQAVVDGAQSADKAAAERENLSEQEIRVLQTVGRERCCIMSGIASAIRLSLSSVTGLIDRLCDKKLVRRDRSPEDRRIVQVELTEEGRSLHQSAMAGRVGLAREMLKGLSAEEQEKLVALLGKASAGLKAKKDG